MNERDKNHAWATMDSGKKVNILLYLYKLETQSPVSLQDSLEAFNFKSYGITREDLPEAVLKLRGEGLRRAAHAVTGKIVNELDAWYENPGRNKFLWESEEVRKARPFFFRTEAQEREAAQEREEWLKRISERQSEHHPIGSSDGKVSSSEVHP